jgi:hypothetical protein
VEVRRTTGEVEVKRVGAGETGCGSGGKRVGAGETRRGVEVKEWDQGNWVWK